ncbi:hypothetical protein NYZ99_15690 [Maribacter litopenaei]|uniref:DUF4136 domain-containing protein n=1 Tax=Maribacter litopenaei TaxID=2976127 RepID=A0ABY5Y5Q7_9FLAO|nr:hypothetical protein [Maribacter litopenaei]UWX54367.1 hypothetical protein NYZ99_15690 [Maribacter litopenaei]
MKVKLLLTIFGTIFFLNCTYKGDEKASTLALVPENSPVIIKINDFDTFTSEIKENEILKSFQNSDRIAQLANRLKPLKYVKSQLGGYLAITDHPKKDFDFVYIPTDSLPQIVLDSTTNKIVEKIVKGDLEFSRYEIDGSIFYTSIIQNKEIVGSSESAIEMVSESIRRSVSRKKAFCKI